jgi:hypothetical protein
MTSFCDSRDFGGTRPTNPTFPVRTPVSDPPHAARGAARTKANKRFRVEILVIIMRLDESEAPEVPSGLAQPVTAVHFAPPDLFLAGMGLPTEASSGPSGITRFAAGWKCGTA